jgi:hypothetical protein
MTAGPHPFFVSRPHRKAKKPVSQGRRSHMGDKSPKNKEKKKKKQTDKKKAA